MNRLHPTTIHTVWVGRVVHDGKQVRLAVVGKRVRDAEGADCRTQRERSSVLKQGACTEARARARTHGVRPTDRVRTVVDIDGHIRVEDDAHLLVRRRAWRRVRRRRRQRRVGAARKGWGRREAARRAASVVCRVRAAPRGARPQRSVVSHFPDPNHTASTAGTHQRGDTRRKG